MQQISELFQQFPEQNVAKNMYHVTDYNNYLGASAYNMIGKLPIACSTLTIYPTMHASI